MTRLQQALAADKRAQDILKKYGKDDTLHAGEKYSAQQATADNTNEELRMIAKLTNDNKLTWERK